jgi:hypothetical protein
MFFGRLVGTTMPKILSGLRLSRRSHSQNYIFQHKTQSAEKKKYHRDRTEIAERFEKEPHEN